MVPHLKQEEMPAYLIGSCFSEIHSSLGKGEEREEEWEGIRRSEEE